MISVYGQIQTSHGGKNLIQSLADDTWASTTSYISSHGVMGSTETEGLKWDVAMLPALEEGKRTNSIVGGASLWIMEGKTPEEYEATAAFVKYVTAPDTGEKYIAENTGYIPVTTAGFELLKSEGFYEQEGYAGRETAIESLTASEVTPLSRGIRLGNFTSIRAEVRAELEAAFTGQKDIETALSDAADRSNQILRRYEQTYRGADLP